MERRRHEEEMRRRREDEMRRMNEQEARRNPQPRTPEALVVNPAAVNQLHLAAAMAQLQGQAGSSQGPSLQEINRIL